MKILSIALDKKILNENSPSFKRQKDYAGLVAKYQIIVFGSEQEITDGNLSVFGSGGKNKISKLAKGFKKAQEILSQEPNGWLITTQDPFFTALLGWRLKKKFGVKLQIQVHTDFLSPYFRQESCYNNLLYYLGKFLIKKADGIRVVSQRAAGSLVARLGIDKNKITVVPVYANGLSQNSKIKAQNRGLISETGGRFVFLTVGRLVKVKNIDLQIEALSELVKKYPSVELWIVGAGPLKKKLKNKVLELKINDKVKFWGWQTDLAKFYQKADAFLLTSNYEGWPLVIAEALSRGLPIVMTDMGSTGELIKDKVNGLITPVGEKAPLIRSLERLVADNDLRRRLGESALETAGNLPTKEEILASYKKSWEQTI